MVLVWWYVWYSNKKNIIYIYIYPFETGRRWSCEWAHYIYENVCIMLTSQYFIIKILIIPRLKYHHLIMRDLIQLILTWHLFVVKVLIQPFAFVKGEWWQRVKWQQTINAWDISGIFVLFKWTELMPDMNVYEMRKLSRQIRVFWCSEVVMSIAEHQWVKQNIWKS